MSPLSTKRKMVYLIPGLIFLAILIPIITVIGIEFYQFNRNKKLLQDIERHSNASTLVVYFSRSGNTELMANEIARIKNADLLTIEAEEYKIGFKGWINALSDARNTTATISPATINLDSYDTIYIGSPIWLYSPAPPIWEFAKENDFSGKSVILFNSLNSKFEQKYIDEYADLIKQNGGQLINHIYVVRGRMTQQMEVQDFLETVRNKLSIN